MEEKCRADDWEEVNSARGEKAARTLWFEPGGKKRGQHDVMQDRIEKSKGREQK